MKRQSIKSLQEYKEYFEVQAATGRGERKEYFQKFVIMIDEMIATESALAEIYKQHGISTEVVEVAKPKKQVRGIGNMIKSYFDSYKENK